MKLLRSLIPASLKPKTPLQEAKRELIEAELNLLQAHSAKEYAASIIMYREAQVVRLRRYIASLENQ